MRIQFDTLKITNGFDIKFQLATSNASDALINSRY
jgi:hypothetical protein